MGVIVSDKNWQLNPNTKIPPLFSPNIVNKFMTFHVTSRTSVADKQTYKEMEQFVGINNHWLLNYQVSEHWYKISMYQS